MGRGVSAGGGQSSLGYLFGSGESAAANNSTTEVGADVESESASQEAASIDTNKTSVTNNYYRSDGQNCGNFITVHRQCEAWFSDRPSTKVHAEPGGGSSLSYLFSDGKK
ncbi:protein SPIRAL1-like 3 [Salvia splendens]|uniref:protein SPIRAL1-like 3 n=1 Tax=Salvia splendens TaxID=180675 RepID=UPI001C2685A1|nr:protein SPIRAL1-like 3 [Salvia splendens]